jgi:hypothetical protein
VIYYCGVFPNLAESIIRHFGRPSARDAGYAARLHGKSVAADCTRFRAVEKLFGASAEFRENGIFRR